MHSPRKNNSKVNTWLENLIEEVDYMIKSRDWEKQENGTESEMKISKISKLLLCQENNSKRGKNGNSRTKTSKS
jgi:hypothetical protein